MRHRPGRHLEETLLDDGVAAVEIGPGQLAELGQRFGGMTWGTGELAMVTSWWWQTRNLRVWQIEPDGDAEPVDPGLPDGLTRSVVVGVALEVIHEKERPRREEPEGAFVRITLSIDFIDAPIVSHIGIEQSGIIALSI